MVTQDADSITCQIPKPGKPSVTRMVKALRAEVKTLVPLPRGVPLQLTVSYRVGGGAWRPKGDKNSAFLFHLSAPAITSLAFTCSEVLTRAGIVMPGQIVLCTASKVTHDRGDSFLDIKLERLYAACVEDSMTRKHKVAKWYLERSQSTGRSTSYRGYRKILDAIRSRT